MENQLLWKLEDFAFLNGAEGLDTHEEYECAKELLSRNCSVSILDNLYERPEKIKALPLLNPSTLILHVTGTYAEKLNMLLNSFFALNWAPKNVVFWFSGDAEELLGSARKIKKQFGTKFYQIEDINPFDGAPYEVFEIKWI